MQQRQHTRLIALVTSALLMVMLPQPSTARNVGIRFSIPHKYEEVSLATVVCGERFEEAMNLIKSALIFNQRDSNKTLNFIVITEFPLMWTIHQVLSNWQNLVSPSFNYELVHTQFPAHNELVWHNLFLPCAAQRLFIHNVLLHVDAVIYADADMLFVSPVAEMWQLFDKFNSTQIMAMAPEDFTLRSYSYYTKACRFPFYGNFGVNSGVLLMNLTRIRKFQLHKHILNLYDQFIAVINYYDQDLLNILFHYHPDKLYLMSVAYNYRTDFCTFERRQAINGTQGAAVDDIKLLHGSRRSFHTYLRPATIFTTIYQVFDAFTMGASVKNELVQRVAIVSRKKLKANKNCAHIMNSSLKTFYSYFN